MEEHKLRQLAEMLDVSVTELRDLSQKEPSADRRMEESLSYFVMNEVKMKELKDENLRLREDIVTMKGTILDLQKALSDIRDKIKG